MEDMPPPRRSKTVLIEEVDSSGSSKNSTASYDALIKEVESWSYDASNDYDIIVRARRVKRHPYIREGRTIAKPKEVPKNQRSKETHGRTTQPRVGHTCTLRDKARGGWSGVGGRDCRRENGLLIREHKPRTNILPLIGSKDESDEKLSLTVPSL
jgi:hypothetical protein